MTNPVPKLVTANVIGLFALLGIGAGGSAYIAENANTIPETQIIQIQQDRYIITVSEDNETSLAVKIAMSIGYFYESSNQHIGKPYVDKNGAGTPLTVCNGITGKGVIVDKIYTPKECYELEKGRYLEAEKQAFLAFRHWNRYTPMTQAVFLDFIHNKGIGALGSSTLLRMANAGNLVGACKQNERWNVGTVNKVKQVLPGLDIRAKSNAHLCAKG